MNTKPHSMKIWPIAVILVLLAVTVFLATANSAKNTSTPTPSEKASDTDTVQMTKQSAELADLKTSVVTYGTASDRLLLSGTCEPDQNKVAKVTAPVSGRILRLAVSTGQIVQAGSIVAVFDSVDLAEAKKSLSQALSAGSEAEAQIVVASARVAASQRKLARQKEFQQSGVYSSKPVEDAEGELANVESDRRTAESELDRAKSELCRMRELFQSQIVARRDLEVSQAEEKTASAKLQAAQEKVRIAKQSLAREQVVSKKDLHNRREIGDAESELQSARADLVAAKTSRVSAARAIQAAHENVRVLGGSSSESTGTLVVRSPIGGVVLDREVTLGQSVERGSEICEIANTSNIWVIGNAYEKDMPSLGVGQPVSITVNAYPNSIFNGRVTNIGTVLDERSRTIRVRCEVANVGGRLRPGMFAELTVLSSSRPRVLLVPEAAVQEDANKKYVFVVDGKSYRKVDVRLGAASKGFHEVLSGLKDGDKVVTEGSFILKSETKKSEMGED